MVAFDVGKKVKQGLGFSSIFNSIRSVIGVALITGDYIPVVP